MEEEDLDAQENELLALEAIYEDERQFIRSSHESGGELNIYLDVASPFLLLLPLKKDGALENTSDLASPRKEEELNQSVTTLEEVSVQHLPPIVLNFSFPENYPSTSPPCYTLSCKWLNESQVNET